MYLPLAASKNILESIRATLIFLSRVVKLTPALVQDGKWHIFWREEKPNDNEYGGAIFALVKILHDDRNGGRKRYGIR